MSARDGAFCDSTSRFVERDCPDREACSQGFPCAVVLANNPEKKADNVMGTDGIGSPSRLADLLQDWWIELARQEVEAVAPKAIEYGATDLAEIGRTMGLIIQRDGMTNEEATEVGIYFYVLGKMARWTAAIREGRKVSDDTLHDIAVYVKMEQRNRAVGGWPFGPDGEDQA